MCTELAPKAKRRREALRSKRMLLADKLQFAMKALNAAQTTAERRHRGLNLVVARTTIIGFEVESVYSVDKLSRKSACAHRFY